MISPAWVSFFFSNNFELQSLGYVLVHFSTGSLPWLAVWGETNKQRYEKILEKKNSVSEEELCKGLPVEFILYLKYCKSLGFSDKPDYQYLRHLFSDLFKRLGYVDDKYDWTVLKEKGACRKDCAAI